VTPTLSAIVVNYRAAGELPGCLTPLLGAGAEVWMVDNASGDGATALVRERFPSVNLIENKTNEGFAAANNRALERVGGDFVLFVNPDCRINPDSVARLTAYLSSHPEVGIAAPAIRDLQGGPVPSAHRFETTASVLFMLAGGRSLLPGVKRFLARLAGDTTYGISFGSSEPRAVDWASGACLLARTDLMRRLGGFDEGYFLYYEDEDLCRRVWETGSEVVFFPHARATHAGGASTHDFAHVWPELYRSLLRFQALTRPGTYPLVRGAVAVRAVLGMLLGAVRDGAYAASGRPRQHRLLAWRRILRLAVRAPSARARMAWRAQIAEEEVTRP